MNVLDLVQRRGLATRKVSVAKGGEWAGPCPGCGGEDRFHVWPEQNDGGGSWWCRGCQQGGDAIQFLRVFDGLGYKEACDHLGRDPGRPPRRLRPQAPVRQEWRPCEHAEPPMVWQHHALQLVEWCHKLLLSNQEELKRLEARGIPREAVERFRLGWMPEDMWRPREQWGLDTVLKEDGTAKRLWLPKGLVIPWRRDGRVMRVRVRRPEGEPKYYVLPGSSAATWMSGAELHYLVVVEAELDAVAVAAAAGDAAGVIAVQTSRGKPDAEALPVVQSKRLILVALDNDPAGAKGLPWWRDQFPQAVAAPVPEGKDPGDYVKDHNGNLRLWVMAQLPGLVAAYVSGIGGHSALGWNDVGGGVYLTRPTTARFPEENDWETSPELQAVGTQEQCIAWYSVGDGLRRKPKLKLVRTKAGGIDLAGDDEGDGALEYLRQCLKDAGPFAEWGMTG